MIDYRTQIKKYRLMAGLTQTEFARKLDISNSHLNAIEKRRRKPSLRVLEDISYKLNVPLSQLVAIQSGFKSFVTVITTQRHTVLD